MAGVCATVCSKSAIFGKILYDNYTIIGVDLGIDRKA